MTPSRGCPLDATAAAAIRPEAASPMLSSSNSTKWRQTQQQQWRRPLMTVIFSLLSATGQSFVVSPLNVGTRELRAGGNGCSNRRSCCRTPAASWQTGVCRMVADGADAEGQGEMAGEGIGGEAEGASNEEGMGDKGGGTGKGGDGEEQAKEERKMPEFLNPTREELERAFPNMPKAPYPILPDMRTLTAEQIAQGDDMPVSYGGQPAARRANIDFERSERERIHFQTAARVMNYQIQADRQELMEGKKSTEEKRGREAPVIDDIDLLAEFPDEGIEAWYEWDQAPKLITFTGFGVLYNWHLPVGLIMREALGRAHNYLHRLPGPSYFEKHFKNSYKETSFHIPCFGARGDVSSWAWWFHVFTDAYLKTMMEFNMDEDIVLEVIDDIVDEIFFEIMVGPEAFEVVPQVKVVLDRLAAWRDKNGGPKLAVVSNDDERLHTVLENLGLLPYFDFVLTSRETAQEMPEPNIFEMAIETAGVNIARKALHVGYDYDVDITASCEAGMEAVCVKPLQSEYERLEEPYEYHRLIRISELLNRLGLPEAELEFLSRRRGNFWEEDEEDDDDDDEFEQ